MGGVAGACGVGSRLREDVPAIRRMVDLRMKLQAIDGPFLVANGGNRTGIRAGQRHEVADRGTVEGVDLWRELGLVYRRDRSLPRAAQALIALIREHKKPAEPPSSSSAD